MTTTPRTWVVGETVTAALMNTEIRDQFNSFFGAWTTYTPTWTGTSSNPSVGNGNLIGRYLKVGRTVTVHVNLVPGSTSTYGAGNYNFTLPATAANSGCTYMGNAHLLGGARWGGQWLVSPNATQAGPTFPAGTADTRVALMSPTAPETLAAGAQLRMTVTYEAAS
ncbi:hypothetical protein H8N00_10625 [Streptomyces sp. AC563]|uniref:hypothetical protein n=1 Tax=Streptomyces buecherae TaxID=2763006 RepID=UPI00164D882A|nr:hypothetical protein [Streptomyces buecherae]MBC3989326.1 hypothetical protein [Streptomyces buecherae]